MTKIHNGPMLGQEVVTDYGLGRITELYLGSTDIGVTPNIADYQMKFDRKNVKLVPIETED